MILMEYIDSLTKEEWEYIEKTHIQNLKRTKDEKIFSEKTALEDFMVIKSELYSMINVFKEKKIFFHSNEKLISKFIHIKTKNVTYDLYKKRKLYIDILNEKDSIMTKENKLKNIDSLNKGIESIDSDSYALDMYVLDLNIQISDSKDMETYENQILCQAIDFIPGYELLLFPLDITFETNVRFSKEQIVSEFIWIYGFYGSDVDKKSILSNLPEQTKDIKENE